MWTRVSYDTRSQLASECRYKCGHEYPPTRAASWLWRAVTNVQRVSYDTRSQLASEDRDQCGHEYPTTRAVRWLKRAVRNVATSILRHEEPVGFGVPPQMWTRVSYDTSSQLASEGRDQCGHEYPTTQGASWLRRAVTNVATSILRHEDPVGFGVPLQMWTRVSYDTSSQLAS